MFRKVCHFVAVGINSNVELQSWSQYRQLVTPLLIVVQLQSQIVIYNIIIVLLTSIIVGVVLWSINSNKICGFTNILQLTYTVYLETQLQTRVYTAQKKTIIIPYRYRTKLARSKNTPTYIYIKQKGLVLSVSKAKFDESQRAQKCRSPHAIKKKQARTVVIATLTL